MSTRSKTGRVVIVLPDSLMSRIERVVDVAGGTRAGVVRVLVARALAAYEVEVGIVASTQREG